MLECSPSDLSSRNLESSRIRPSRSPSTRQTFHPACRLRCLIQSKRDTQLAFTMQAILQSGLVLAFGRGSISPVGYKPILTLDTSVLSRKYVHIRLRFSEDGNPPWRSRRTVGILDVVIDFLDQFLHAAKRSAAKSLLRNAIEPDNRLSQEA